MKPLNIFDATGSPLTGWNSTIKLNDTAISTLKDKSAKTSNAINAVPSPFSRLHIFDTAFKLITKDIFDKQDRASKVYKELVSDCLDAIELLFNAKYHESQGDIIEFVNWKSSDLSALKSGKAGQQVFAKTLSLFLSQDFEAEEHVISMIRYKGLAIAGTSPYTVLFTSPNLDKVNGQFRNNRYESIFDLVNPETGSMYFKKYVPFSKRSDSFKAYLSGFFENSPELKDKLVSFWNYLDAETIRSVKGDFISRPVVCSDGQPFRVLNKALETNADETASDFFNDHIVKVGYKIDNQKFITPKYKIDTEDRQFDFLIPLKTGFLKNCDLKELGNLLQYEMLGPSSIKVSYKDERTGKEKSKVYNTSTNLKGEGKLIDTVSDFQLNFTVGLFPQLRVLKTDRSPDPTYNNFYKILLAVDAGKPEFLKTANFKLSFFVLREGEIDRISSDGAMYSAKRFERRTFESPDSLSSIYYEVRNTHFDFIEVELQKGLDMSKIHGIVIPKWKEKLVGDKQIDFSIDFGTTNTFISYTDDITHTSVPKPFDITTDDLQMVMLQQNEPPKGGNSITSTFTKGITSVIVSSVVVNEFVPPVLLPQEKSNPYKMPFRTAVFQKKNIQDFGLFDDINIHFAYQKHFLDASAASYQEIVSNLKWDITNKDDLGSKKRVDRFIQQLCLMLKFKILLNDGDPSKTVVNWFIPQSLSEAAKSDYNKLWSDNVSKVLGSKKSPKMVLEAEAPYYFLKRGGDIISSSSVLSIDIGGGSTDAMLFMNDIPRIGTSFNFAGNVLWGNGYNQFTSDAKDNGFYQKIKPKLEGEIDKNLLLKLGQKEYEKKSTEEIMNFWLSNSDDLSILENLKNPEFKIVYLIHFTAIIYHLAQLLKSSNFSVPNCVIFSGNGSKYIDFIGDDKLLSKITGYIFNKVFGTNNPNPQIILPALNRKEATCFGGIFKQKDEDFITKSYLGTQLNSEEFSNIRTYNDAERNIVEVRNSVKENIVDMFQLIQGLNDIIPFRSDLNIDINISAVCSFLSSQIESNFDKGYGIRKQKISYEEKITDSLFFYPLIGVIFQLSKISEENIEDFTPNSLLYVSEPAEENVFSNKSLNANKSFNSIYEISVPINNPTEATFKLIEDSAIYGRAFSSREHILTPVCQNVNLPDSANINIRMLNKGRLRKDGDNWIVTEKLKIEFI